VRQGFVCLVSPSLPPFPPAVDGAPCRRRGRGTRRSPPCHDRGMEELRAAGKVGADGILANDAFRDDASVTMIVLPEGVVGIADGSWRAGAFSECTNLVEVVLPESCTSLGDGAFRDCSSLATITLPASLTTLGVSAFWGCSSLTTISLPASLTTIGAFAFYGCPNLQTLLVSPAPTSTLPPSPDPSAPAAAASIWSTLHTTNYPHGPSLSTLPRPRPRPHHRQARRHLRTLHHLCGVAPTPPCRTAHHHLCSG
jgi:hypothetical protein